MSLSAWMLTSFLIGATPMAPADGAANPKFDKGMEMTWRGSFSEAILRTGSKTFRLYDVEARAFVLDCSERGADLALLTSIKLKPDVKTVPEPPPIVRLQLLRVDARGNPFNLSPDSLAQVAARRQPSPLPLMPLEGLPTLDRALFVALPEGKLEADHVWGITENQRPDLKLKLDGSDSVRGVRAWKIVALQQTEDWDALKIEQPVWRRGESIWIAAQHGWITRVERTIEKREPQTGDVSFRSKLALDHVGRMTYPGRLGEDRRQEISAALTFIAEYDQLIADASRAQPEAFDRLLRQIDQHITNNFTGDTLPYREPILWIKSKTEAAKRGQIPPAALPPETAQPVTGLKMNRLAPDVTIRDLTHNESIRLGKLRGRPVVLLYYQPGSAKTAELVLSLAQSLHSKHGDKAFILPLAIGANEAAIQQHNDLRLTVHVLSGLDVYRTHGIEATPTFVVLDANGIVKRIVGGWSDENAVTVRTELEKCLK